MTQKKFAQISMLTPVGKLYLVASEKGLCGLYWKKQNAPMVKTKILTQAAKQLKQYFSGIRKKFDLPLDLEGTPFQRSVWEELAKIPFGQTCSYQDIAKRLKNANAMRAVGSANGKNPLCIIVPCHRVIAADGKIGGYSAGLSKKIKLLKHEQRFPKKK